MGQEYASLDGGFKSFLFSSLPGEMIQFDDHIFHNGLVQPPTSRDMFFFLEKLSLLPSFLPSFLPSTKQQQKKSWAIQGGGFIYFLFSPLFGKFGGNDPIWRSYFSSGLVQPPTRISLHPWGVFVLFWSVKLQAFQAFVKGTKMQSINVWELSGARELFGKPPLHPRMPMA